MVRLKHASLTIVLVAFMASAGDAQAPQTARDADRPDFKVQVWGDLAADFSARVSSYVELRSELEKGLPPFEVTDRPAEIKRAERALARRIRVARATARSGDIFTPAISGAFKNALLLAVDANIRAAIRDDNPGAFSVRINGTYPDGKPLSTVPPSVVAALPQLPEVVQYRFLGRHLVLYDVNARVVLDEIPYAIRSREER